MKNKNYLCAVLLKQAGKHNSSKVQKSEERKAGSRQEGKIASSEVP